MGLVLEGLIALDESGFLFLWIKIWHDIVNCKCTRKTNSTFLEFEIQMGFLNCIFALTGEVDWGVSLDVYLVAVTTATTVKIGLGVPN